MQEIVDEVLHAEQTAEQIVKDARQKSMEMKNAFENEMSEKVKAAKEDAQKYIQEAVKEAKENAEKTYETAVKEAEKKNLDFYSKNEEKIKLIIDEITRIIITPEYNRE
jgi:V/A-type H+-transporting ATPase subunit G/H